MLSIFDSICMKFAKKSNQLWCKTTLFFLFLVRNWFFFSFFYFKSKNTNSKCFRVFAIKNNALRFFFSFCFACFLLLMLLYSIKKILIFFCNFVVVVRDEIIIRIFIFIALSFRRLVFFDSVCNNRCDSIFRCAIVAVCSNTCSHNITS